MEHDREESLQWLTVSFLYLLSCAYPLSCSHVWKPKMTDFLYYLGIHSWSGTASRLPHRKNLEVCPDLTVPSWGALSFMLGWKRRRSIGTVELMPWVDFSQSPSQCQGGLVLGPNLEMNQTRKEAGAGCLALLVLHPTSSVLLRTTFQIEGTRIWIC